jgi:hypothetical protein
MRAGLRWGLAASALAAAAAQFWPQQRVATVAAVDRPERASARAQVAAADGPLPTVLEPLTLERATRDPFAAAPNPPPITRSTAIPSVAPSPSPPAPTLSPPPPPPMLWRYLGAMTNPEGERLVMLTRDEGVTVVAVTGLRLDDGFEVVAVDAKSVRLRHPGHTAELVIPILPAPVADR